MLRSPNQYSVMPALCLDLDGTVRYSLSGKFIQNSDDIALYPQVENVLWKWRSYGFLIAAITNQGSVGHGIKTPAQEQAEMQKTISLFKNNPFHAIQRCYNIPHGQVFPYNYRSLCRKPDIGMLALLEHSAFKHGVVIDWDKSIMVGDMETDQRCANQAKIRFHWAWDFFNRPRDV